MLYIYNIYFLIYKILKPTAKNSQTSWRVTPAFLTKAIIPFLPPPVANLQFYVFSNNNFIYYHSISVITVGQMSAKIKFSSPFWGNKSPFLTDFKIRKSSYFRPQKLHCICNIGKQTTKNFRLKTDFKRQPD